MRSALLVTSALVGCAVSLPTSPSPFALFETHRAPVTFTKLPHPPPPSHRLTLRIGLKQKGDGQVDTYASEVSDPRHPKYGEFLEDDHVAALTAPAVESVEAIAAWLASHDLVPSWSKNKDWVVVADVELVKVEKILDAKYALYRHADGEVLVRTEAWSLPSHLHKHVDLVQPTTMFGRLRPQGSTIANVDFDIIGSYYGPNDGAPAACTDPRNVTSLCLRQLYHTDQYVPRRPGQNALGITGYLGEYAQYADLAMFLQAERPDQVGYKFQVQLAPGGVNPQGFNATEISNRENIEANLDTQTAAGFTAPTTNIFYSTPGSPPFVPDASTPNNTNEPYLDWLDYIESLPITAIPKVITTSYGDSESTVPQSYAVRVCNAFRNLGARGVSLIFSSGDSGVGPNGTCVTNDGKNTSTFLPIFPASCPWVTSVGATENFHPEEAVSRSGPGGFTSGGGFSRYFQAPLYQALDVFSYTTALRGEYDGLYNKRGRGFPDVAAQGAKYRIVWNNRFGLVGGTSAAAPTFASVITLLNDVRLSRGGRPLGFLNPWLYTLGRYGLNDITSGSSAGCNTTGFPARPGWDAVTGLGSPDFSKLRTLV